MSTLPDFDISQIDVQNQLKALERFECEDSLYAFLSRAWKYIDASSFQGGWPIQAMCEHLQAVCDGDIKRLIINVPPRHGKSSLVSVAYPAWTWAQTQESPTSGPGVQFLSASYANQLALRDSVKSRRLIESPWYQDLWGDRFKLNSDQNTKSRFSNDRGGERLITSVGAAVTGEGGNCFVAGTGVATPSGTVKIEDIAPGTEVYGVDTLRGKVVKTIVSAVRRVRARNLHEVSVSNGVTLRCSGDHPFFQAEKRRYVEAASLGRGDRLWLLGAEKGQDQNSAVLEMQLVSHAVFQAPVRSAQGAEKESYRCLLLRRLPGKAPCGEELYAGVCGLPDKDGQKGKSVLLGGVHEGKARQRHGEAPGERVQVLRERLHGQSAASEVLQRVLPEHEPFTEHSWGEEPEIRERRSGPLRSLLHGAATADSGARRGIVCGVRMGSPETAAIKRETGIAASCPPRRRESEEQLPRESGFSVRFVPSDSPPIREATVLAVEKYSGREDWMYDIQVEGTNNFFAGGILVHNCIIVDDPNSAAEAFSEATIQSTIDWWTNAMSTRLNDQKTGAYIIIQQRLAENDLTGHLQETESDGWAQLILPMRYEPERSFMTPIGWKDPRVVPGELLSPERFGEVEVKSLERTLGKYQAAGQLQQRPEPAGGGIIKREWWQLWENASFPPMDYILASLDTAYTKNTERDPSAMTVWGVFTTDENAVSGRIIDRDGRPMYFDRAYNETAPKLMLMYAWSEHLEFHDLIKKVEKTCSSFKVDKLLVENKAAGISLAQELRRLYTAANFGVQLSDPKSMDKMARLFSVQHLFEEGIIYAPDKIWAETTITQVGQFPRGKHDDLVDTCSMAVRHLRDIGLLTRSSERLEEIAGMTTYPGGADVPLYPV